MEDIVRDLRDALSVPLDRQRPKLSRVLVDIWTAYEVLCQDIALEFHPEITEKKLAKLGVSGGEPDKISARFDIIFGSHVSPFFGSKRHMYIKDLYAFRNVFAHRAGIANKQFLKRTKHIQSLARLTIGDGVPLPADWVCFYLVEMDAHVIDLVNHVAEALTQKRRS